MRITSCACFVVFILFSVGCVAQDYREEIANQNAECIFKYRESLGAFIAGDDILFADGINVINIPAGRVGAGDSWVEMPSCDREKWHCIIGVGAPLFIPRPFDKGTSSWSHDGYYYAFGKNFRLDLRRAIKVMPLLVYRAKNRSLPNVNMDVESVYFFDEGMNLIGYANEISKLREGSYSLDSAWLEGDRADLDCY